jgi:hypothetical protein
MAAATGPEAEWHEHLRGGRFMLQRARASGTFVFPPRIAVPGSGEGDLQWVEASGRGTVFATTVVRGRPPSADYNVALVALEEGPRLMSTVLGVAPADVRIGLAVQARIDAADEGPRLVFEPQAADHRR